MEPAADTPQDTAPGIAPPCLILCTTCRAGRTLAEGETPPGQILFDSLAAALAAHPAPPVTLRAAKCLSVCAQGCAGAMTQAGKWSYLLGRLDQAPPADLLAYAETYAAHPTGAVLPSRRPESLRGAVLGRLPSLTDAPQESAA